jgi:hypothetical protein
MPHTPWSALTPEQQRAKYLAIKAWKKANPEKVAAYDRDRRERRRTHVYAQQKAWRDRNAAHYKERDAANHRRRRAANPEQERQRMQRWRDRLELRLVAAAGRPRPTVCDLCKLDAVTVFDHDHTTGDFRGWLCTRCNLTLGRVKDDVDLLMKMIDYLVNGGCVGTTDDRGEEPITQLRLCASKGAQVSHRK